MTDLTDFRFRPAKDEDTDRLLEIHASVFPDPRGPEERRRNFHHNALGGLADLHVVELEGRLLAHAFLFPLEVWIGGRPVPAGGVASVGVAPEARGRRIASRLLTHLHELSHARGDVMTMLYPFRQGFYLRHGYAPVTPSRRLTFTPHALPKPWSLPPSGLVVRPIEGADREGIERAYLRAAGRTTGWITRPPRLWDARLLDERRRWFVATRGSGVVGFVSWLLTQAAAHGAITLAVLDLVADDDEVRRALLGLVGAQRDQAHRVELEVDQSDAIDRALVDADLGSFGTPEMEHPLGVVAGGPLVRVPDPTRALVARGYANDGGVDLEVEGERLRVESHAGQAQITATRASAPLVLDRPTLAAIVCGGLSPTDAARIGWLQAPDPGTLRAADALFALPPYFAVDPF